MRLDIGAGTAPLDGFESVDLAPPADHVGDFLEMNFTDVEQVEMSHVLEHVSFHRTHEALERIRSWMVPGGHLRVEVPDCAVLVDMDPADGVWNQWMFGPQGGPGGAHLAGFIGLTLDRALVRAGWRVLGLRSFTSSHPHRPGYPCLEATACA